ncbi:MAG: phenylacetic acid degradation protein [Rhizobiales bacterium]|nr:phenylacetic acid degradation protein [Hyphomicrobiales bacterium]
MSDAIPPKLDIEALGRFLSAEFSQAYHPGSGLVIEEVWHGGARVRQRFRDDLIRPGGTMSGPTMMALADFAMYCAVLAAIGPVPLAVTISFSINFLRRPAQRDLLAEARLFKLGKRLAVGEVTIRSEGDEEPVAHVTATYSVPPRELR